MKALNWRTTCGERNQAFLVKGTVLAVALCGDHSRFLIEEFRSYPDGEADRSYRVRDADAVSDAEVREGKYSPVVAWLDSEADAIAFCRAA